MLTIFGFVFGLAGGAAGTAAWLLSDPDQRAVNASTVSASPGSRVEVLKARVAEALADGQRAGAETESRFSRERVI